MQIAVLRKLLELQENMERQFSENRKIINGQSEKLNKEIEMIKKKKPEKFWKNKMNEIKKCLECYQQQHGSSKGRRNLWG